MSEKLCDKIVRVEVTDGRQYIGIFQSCDKTGCVFITEALELVHLSPDQALQHDLFDPHILTYPVPESQLADPYPKEVTLQPKYLGNVNICRKDLKRILLDKKGQQFYDEMVSAFKTNDFITEQCQRSVEQQEKREKYEEWLKERADSIAQTTKSKILSAAPPLEPHSGTNGQIVS